MGLRRMVALVRELPDDSATARYVGQGWSIELELAALGDELLHHVYRAVLASAGVRQLPKPLKLPRPTDREPARTGPRRQATPQEVVAMLDGMMHR